MAKKKKTREQKKVSDLRRETTMAVYSLTPESIKPAKKIITQSSQIAPAISTNAYHYLSHDLRKTALFTVAVITMELVLRVVLTNS